MHRDLKPENILVTREHLKIGDVGLAKLMYDVQNSKQRINQSFHQYLQTSACGTLPYMAPEMFDEQYGQRSQRVLFGFNNVHYITVSFHKI